MMKNNDSREKQIPASSGIQNESNSPIKKRRISQDKASNLYKGSAWKKFAFSKFLEEQPNYLQKDQSREIQKNLNFRSVNKSRILKRITQSDNEELEASQESRNIENFELLDEDEIKLEFNCFSCDHVFDSEKDLQNHLDFYNK